MRLTILLAALFVLVASAVAFVAMRESTEAAWPGLEGRIAFHNTGVNPGIYSVNANGTDLQQLTTGSHFYPSWSPDGEEIVYQVGAELIGSGPTAIGPQGCGGPGIYAMDADGSNEHFVACGIHPSWSSDGTQIVYVDDGDIWIMNATGTPNSHPIVNISGNEYYPVMSPNGTKIAYTKEVIPSLAEVGGAQPQGPVSTYYQLWMMDAAGSNQVMLDDFDSQNHLPFPSDWAPDGSRLVYYDNGSIITVTTGGVITTKFLDASAPEPAFSPDGAPIVYSRYAPGFAQCPPDDYDYVIAVIPEGGNSSTDVVGDVGSCEDEYRHPDWQPLTSPPTPSPSPTASPSPTVTPSGTLGGETDSATPTATASPTATATAAPTSPGETAAPTDTPGPTPIIKDVVWGDDQCDDEPNPVDALFTLRFDAGLTTNTGGCPPMDKDITILEVLPAGIDEQTEGNWGNVDCDDETNPVDSLKILRYDAGFDSDQDEPCPEIGADVRISYFP